MKLDVIKKSTRSQKWQQVDTLLIISILVCFLTFALDCPFGLAQQKIEGTPLVLKGATVIDGLGGRPFPDAVLVIEGEKVKSLGGKGTNYPPEATVVDLSGKFIIPGLIDSHTHYEEWMGELFLNHGVTSIMAMGGKFGKQKEISQKSNSRTPRMYDTAGDPRLSASMTQDQVRASVQEWLKGKPDFSRIRAPEEFTPMTLSGRDLKKSEQVYQWAAEEIHRAGLITFGHTSNAPKSITAGQDIVEHIWGFATAMMSTEEYDAFQRGQYLHWGMFLKDWARLDQVIKEAVEQKAYLNPTFFFELGSLSQFAAKHEQEAYRLYSDPSLMVYFPQGIAQSLLQKQRQIRNFSSKYENLVMISRLIPDELREFRRSYQAAGEFVRRYVQAGGKVQAGTDTVSGGTPALCLHQEIELFVEAGLTPMQALQSATLWSAEILSGKEGALGKPKVGYLGAETFADLVVLSANPLENIGNTQKIERVMKGGKFIDLGYTPSYFTFTSTPRRIAMATPQPELSAIVPHTVIEGSPEFEMVVEGVGFVTSSVVRIGGISMPTTFLTPRSLKVKIPANVVKSAEPNPFEAPGPEQKIGVFGDRTVPVTVYNAPPEGGTSNSVSLRIQAKWRADLK